MQRRNFLSGLAGLFGAGVVATAAPVGAKLVKDIPQSSLPSIDEVLPKNVSIPCIDKQAAADSVRKIAVLEINERFDRFADKHWTPFEHNFYVPDKVLDKYGEPTQGSGEVIRNLTQSDAECYVKGLCVDKFTMDNTDRWYIYHCPHRADRILVPMCEYTTSVDWPVLDRSHEMSDRAMQVASTSIWRRLYLDQWHTALAAATDRNIVVYDSEKAGFTKRLVSLMKIVARANRKNSYAPRLDTLVIGTDCYEETFGTLDGRRRIANVDIRYTDELDQGGEFYEYYTGELGGTFPTRARQAVFNDREELAVGFDTRSRRGATAFQSWTPSSHQLTAHYHDEHSQYGAAGRDTVRFNMRVGVCTIYADCVLLGAF